MSGFVERFSLRSELLAKNSPGESENLFDLSMAVWDWSNEDVSKISRTGPPAKVPRMFHQQFLKEVFFWGGWGEVWGPIFPGYVGKIIEC